MSVIGDFGFFLERLNRQGFEEAAHHFALAKSALDRSEWESSNAQIRAGLESLFNQIAALRLGTKKTGGSARAELEAAQLLRGREARLVQEFIAVAGGGLDRMPVCRMQTSRLVVFWPG